METQNYLEVAYILAVCLFIFGLKELSGPKTARRGNALASLGMLIAIVATLWDWHIVSFPWIVAGVLLGSGIGLFLAYRVQMTQMPQFVALFNGFGGLASLFVALSEYTREGGAFADSAAAATGAAGGEMQVALWIVALSAALSVLIGGVTFTGSMVAFAKLQGLMTTKPIGWPAQKAGNAMLLVAMLACSYFFAMADVPAWYWIALITAGAFVLGVTGTVPIGGADMPVVISLLNSYSGLAASAAGFVLGNRLLIVAGALVGASGLILTKIMCVAMNRSLANVLFAGVGADAGGSGGGSGEKRTVRNYTMEDAALEFESARNVVIVPGYGMAVAQAQHAIKELDDLLSSMGKTVKYAIHPVAGRMPGHMNVLLAEVNVPYEKLVEMEEINLEFPSTDVALVVGANDVINPAARTAKDSPIYGMPILDVDKSRRVMIVKRSLGSGFAGIDNELFYDDEKTMMLFGDAKKVALALVTELKKLNE